MKQFVTNSVYRANGNKSVRDNIIKEMVWKIKGLVITMDERDKLVEWTQELIRVTNVTYSNNKPLEVVNMFHPERHINSIRINKPNGDAVAILQLEEVRIGLRLPTIPEEERRQYAS